MPTPPIDPAIQTILADWCHGRPVRLCVLFGSRATGQARADSDVDIAVWPVAAVEPLQKLAWIQQLETALHREVSLVVVTPALNPVLGFEIAKHGRLIFEAEPEAWAGARLYLWHQYNDSLPFRRGARQVLHKFAAEVLHGS